jgi:exopolyphosphatase/guanosine-5'-triphosphate,3'-diphosphate pyrophosphatase
VTRYAAVDCGTNAIRLLVAEVDNDTIVDIVREMRTVRLGEGIDATGEISAAALDRTLSAVEDYARTIQDMNVGAVRMVATSASRDARNAQEFVVGVRDRLGVAPEVIAGKEEATLSFIGAVRGLPSDALASPVLVADIGGGSTEFVLGDVEAGRQDVIARTSVDIGCVRMTERYLHDDPPTREQVEATVATINAVLDDAFAQVPIGDVSTFVGLAGSVTTVAALAHELPAYEAAAIHGSVTTLAQVETVTDRLVAMTKAERAELAVMHPGRVDVIAGGALVLREILRRLPVDTVVASETDLLDGIVYTLAAHS